MNINRITAFIGTDKITHFLGCYAICASLYVVVGWVWEAVLVSFIVGCCKELLDFEIKGNYWSWGDFLANILGVLFFLFQLYLNNRLL